MDRLEAFGIDEVPDELPDGAADGAGGEASRDASGAIPAVWQASTLAALK